MPRGLLERADEQETPEVSNAGCLGLDAGVRGAQWPHAGAAGPAWHQVSRSAGTLLADSTRLRGVGGLHGARYRHMAVRDQGPAEIGRLEAAVAMHKTSMQAHSVVSVGPPQQGVADAVYLDAGSKLCRRPWQGSQASRLWIRS